MEGGGVQVGGLIGPDAPTEPSRRKKKINYVYGSSKLSPQIVVDVNPGGVAHRKGGRRGTIQNQTPGKKSSHTISNLVSKTDKRRQVCGVLLVYTTWPLLASYYTRPSLGTFAKREKKKQELLHFVNTTAARSFTLYLGVGLGCVGAGVTCPTPARIKVCSYLAVQN